MSNQFDVLQAHEIPFFDHGTGLKDTVRNSSKRRNMNPVHFALRKVKNIVLFRIPIFKLENMIYSAEMSAAR